jgi:hypothetical protein
MLAYTRASILYARAQKRRAAPFYECALDEALLVHPVTGEPLAARAITALHQTVMRRYVPLTAEQQRLVDATGREARVDVGPRVMRHLIITHVEQLATSAAARDRTPALAAQRVMLDWRSRAEPGADERTRAQAACQSAEIRRNTYNLANADYTPVFRALWSAYTGAYTRACCYV